MTKKNVETAVVMPERKKPGPPTKYTDEWMQQEAKNLMAWVKRDEGLYLGDFCHERGYSRQRLLEFAAKCEDFAEAMDRAKTWQERKLIRGALLREYDPGFARYTMARICGPLWKASYDKEEELQDKTIELVINEVKR